MNFNILKVLKNNKRIKALTLALGITFGSLGLSMTNQSVTYALEGGADKLFTNEQVHDSDSKEKSRYDENGIEILDFDSEETINVDLPIKLIPGNPFDFMEKAYVDPKYNSYSFKYQDNQISITNDLNNNMDIYDRIIDQNNNMSDEDKMVVKNQIKVMLPQNPCFNDNDNQAELNLALKLYTLGIYYKELEGYDGLYIHGRKVKGYMYYVDNNGVKVKATEYSIPTNKI